MKLLIELLKMPWNPDGEYLALLGPLIPSPIPSVLSGTQARRFRSDPEHFLLPQNCFVVQLAVSPRPSDGCHDRKQLVARRQLRREQTIESATNSGPVPEAAPKRTRKAAKKSKATKKVARAKKAPGHRARFVGSIKKDPPTPIALQAPVFPYSASSSQIPLAVSPSASDECNDRNQLAAKES